MHGLTNNIELKSSPWVEIGTDVSNAKSVPDILRKSNLNYDIELISVFDEDGNELNGFYAIRRSNKKNTVYGFVKDRYVAPQNVVEFTFFDKYIKHTGGSYGFAGSLYDGEIVWFFSRDPELIDIDGIKIRIYSMLTLYQTGRHSKQIVFIPVREDTNSVLIAPIYGVPNSINIQNKKSLVDETEMLEMLIELKDDYVKAITTQLKQMKNTIVTPKDEKTFFNNVVSNSPDRSMNTLSGTFANKIAHMSDFYKNHPTQKNIRGTALGLYMAVSGYYMHVKDYSSPEKRFNNTFIQGDAYRALESAFRVSMKMVREHNRDNNK